MVDLSQLPLSGQQIFDMIITRQPDLDTLNLSHNERVSIDVVERLLVALPRLRRLLVLDTGITEEEAIALLERRPELIQNVEAFIHPAFHLRLSSKGHTSISRTRATVLEHMPFRFLSSLLARSPDHPRADGLPQSLGNRRSSRVQLRTGLYAPSNGCLRVPSA